MGKLADEKGRVLVAALNHLLKGAAVADLDGVLEEGARQLVEQASVLGFFALLGGRRAGSVYVEELVVERGSLAHLAEDGAVCGGGVDLVPAAFAGDPDERVALFRLADGVAGAVTDLDGSRRRDLHDDWGRRWLAAAGYGVSVGVGVGVGMGWQ